MHKSVSAAIALLAMVSFSSAARAQVTTTHTNRRGDIVTSSRSAYDGQHTTYRTVTTPLGLTHTNEKTQRITAHGRVVTTDTRIGPKGQSVTRSTVHGYYGNRTSVTGPNGGTRTYVRHRR